MKWKQPPIIKIYEALGTVADGRITVEGDSAKVFSSSGNKFYEVSYDPIDQAIMANDNGSYWTGALGYPSIAYLFKVGILEYRENLAILLKGIAWKDINQKFKNDFDKTLAFILDKLDATQRDELTKYALEVDAQIKKLNLNMLGKKVLPPQGY